MICVHRCSGEEGGTSAPLLSEMAEEVSSLETTPLATAKLYRESCELPVILWEVSFPPGGV